ncbi:MAG: hypothetical protein ACN4GF_08630 [Lentimonas sp.]
MKLNLLRSPRLAIALFAGFTPLSANPAASNFGYTQISSLEELREAARKDDQKIRMAPGSYVLTETEPENKIVFEFSGSNNTFDLTDVRIELPTEVLRDMAKTPVHGIKAYYVTGDDLTFKGGHFEDIGDHPPRISVPAFTITGNDVSFTGSMFIVRGSSPYGVGDMLGKGRGSAVRLQKHSAMSILGDRTLLDDCKFRIHTYGHGIHIHGSQDTHLRDVLVMGDQRKTDDIYNSKDPFMAQFDYKIQYPDWLKGQPIPKGQMIGLTEDGIRAYTDGADKDGNTRRTGHITVERCGVNGMRGGITLALASSATVTDSFAINCSHAFSLPSNSTVKNCKGNAAFGPLLTMPYAHKGNSEIEIELYDTKDKIGDHPLALITGSGHKITITSKDEVSQENLRPIILGSTGSRYTEATSSAEELEKRNKANEIILTNLTMHPVQPGPYSSSCKIKSKGEVFADEGRGNKIKNL